MNKNYKNLIFTTHGLERLKDRSISQNAIYKTINHPDFEKKMDEGKIKFFRTINNRKIQTVATYLKKEKKWLIISVWVRGEEDKLPLMWRIIVLPFKIVWWILKKTFSKK